MIRVSHALQELNINNFNLIGNPKSEQEFNNNFIKFEPTKPAPPVINIFFIIHLNKLSNCFFLFSLEKFLK